MSKDKIGDRMKSYYEKRTKDFLTRRTNTLIRLDGKSFSKYTSKLDKPFDEGFIEDMQEVTKYLCSEIQGCKLGYTQSDEITLLLVDYDKIGTDAWFDGNVQKIVSVSSSLATAKFNQLRLYRKFKDKGGVVDNIEKFWDKKDLPCFDSRVFQIPEKEEVVNCFIWRQQDATRNSIQMLSRSLYSHNDVKNKNTKILQDMCWEKGENWNDLHPSKKRGSLVANRTYINDMLIDDVFSIEKNSKYVYQPDLESTNYPSPHGRLLEYGIVEDRYVDIIGNKIRGEGLYEIPIEKKRTKWEVVDTPIFTKNREVILNSMRFKND